jgi:hypothetical protein
VPGTSNHFWGSSWPQKSQVAPTKSATQARHQHVLFGRSLLAGGGNGRPQRLPPFLHVRPRALWLECGPVEKKKRLPPSRPAESPVAVCMPAASKDAIWQHHRQQAGKRSGKDIAKGLSHLILVRSVTGEPCRHLEHKVLSHKAASEPGALRSKFQQRQHHWATGPNGVSELGLAPHRATVINATTHSPAEVARKKPRVGVGCPPVSCRTPARR